MTVPMTCPHKGRPGDPCPECNAPTDPSVTRLVLDSPTQACLTVQHKPMMESPVRTMLPTCTDLDHEALTYHGHSDCLNSFKESGPYQWIVYTWPCKVCRERFAWMLVAERKVDNGMGDWDWSGPTVKGPVFRIPTLDAR